MQHSHQISWKKFKQKFTARKLTAAVFWDRKGMLMVEFIQGTTMSQVKWKLLKILQRAIKNKRCGMLTYGVMLFHDNACLHTAARTRALLVHFNWELFNHPDLTPSNYHLFTYLKNWLWSQSFNNNEYLTEGVKTRLSSQAAYFLTQAYKNLFPDITSAPVQEVTTFRSSLCTYFLNKLYFLTACFINSSTEVTIQTALIHLSESLKSYKNNLHHDYHMLLHT
jgi:hypothetical protein